MPDSERRRRDSGRALRRRRPLSVRARIVVSILLVTAFGLAASGVASYLVQRGRVLASVDAQLIHTVSQLHTIAAGDQGAPPPASVDALLRTAMQRIVPEADEGVLGIINGKPSLVPAAPLPYRIEHDDALVKRIVAEASATNVVSGTAKSTLGTLRYLIVPVSVAGDPARGLYVDSYNLDAVLGDVAQSFQTYLLVAASALALIGLVAWLVSGRLLRPIRLLRDAAAAGSAADLSQRIPVSGHDDVSELTSTINGMFDRLEHAFTSQQQLIDDVGHALKTPITIIRGHLELLDSSNPAEIRATRELAIDELDRMSTLVAEISLLAESHAVQFVRPIEVDLGALTESVLAKARGLDPEREWQSEPGASGFVRLDVRRVTQAWLQLASNAAKYSTPGSPIVLASERVSSRAGDWLHLSVRDSGPGIPSELQSRIFERFERLEPNRSAEGSGLGLAIVAAIAAAHGGTVLLTSTLESGSTFTIRIPWREQAVSAEDEEQQ